jgi:hypothetical protein
MVFMTHRTIFASWAETLCIKCQFTKVQEQFFLKKRNVSVDEIRISERKGLNEDLFQVCSMISETFLNNQHF